MNDPKILLKRARVIFDLVCCLLALYMAAKMIDRFREDANSTSIAYKKYGHTFDDKYPSFSICLEGDHLYRFNETSIFVAYGMLRSDYEMMLNGERAIQYHYDHSSRLYNKKFLPSKFMPIGSFGIETFFGDFFHNSMFITYS